MLSQKSSGGGYGGGDVVSVVVAGLDIRLESALAQVSFSTT